MLYIYIPQKSLLTSAVALFNNDFLFHITAYFTAMMILNVIQSLVAGCYIYLLWRTVHMRHVLA